MHVYEYNPTVKITRSLYINNAPINIMPHYPPPGQCRGNGGAFDLILTLKVAPYMGNLTRTITHVRKCVITE